MARGYLHLDEHLYAGKVDGQARRGTLPFPLTRQLLERGQQRFNIYCTPCHDYLGSGQGMIVRRGFSAPPSFHIERLAPSALGHFFDGDDQWLWHHAEVWHAGLRARPLGHRGVYPCPTAKPACHAGGRTG